MVNTLTVDLLLQVAFGCGLVDHILEDSRAVLAARDFSRGKVVRIGVTGVGLLQDGHSGLFRDAGNELVGDGPQKGCEKGFRSVMRKAAVC
jgi:hypothetical protein